MPKILSTIILILAILLAPPATLAFISQNALPGDTLYPVKRTLESTILNVSTVHPSTKSFYSIAYSQRRYKEATSLIAQGKKNEATQSLGELVMQTTQATDNIKQLKSSQSKKDLIGNLQKSIDEYDLGLNKIHDELAMKAEDGEKLPLSSIKPGEEKVDLPIPSPSGDVVIEIPGTTSRAKQEDAKLQQEIETTVLKLDELKQDLERELEETNSATDVATPVDIDEITRDLDSVDIDGLENTLNSTIDKYLRQLE